MPLKDEKFVEAKSYLEESGEGLANGPDNNEALSIINELELFGCKVFARLFALDYDCDPYFDAELYVKMPETITVELVVLLGSLHADEISQEENGLIRLWWD